MMKHTPGPWYLAADAENTMITAEHGIQVAIWPPQGGTIEQCANARLIAAAPDLLEALQRLLERASKQLDTSCNHEGLQNIDAIVAARAAIEKATGE